MTKVLIVDDEPVQLRLTSAIAEKAGFSVITANGGDEALALLSSGAPIGAVVLDLVMPDRDGMSVMEAMREKNISVPVIVQTANSSLETVISAMRLGAADFFVKPVAPERLIVSLQNALKLSELETFVQKERDRVDGVLGFDAIIARSHVTDRALDLAQKAAKSTITVLIEGESGVGKELFARAIQGSGDRAGKPFIAVNCGAIPPDLIESTLFGHKKGAFTGAIADHAGKFQEAHGGTLFLDEVGELPPSAQVKLLRALQEGEIEPVGAAKPVKVNVRVISATNRRLLNLTRDGAFREDLYYRLNVFPIYVPPLRDRTADILPLASHFLARFTAETGRRVTGFTQSAEHLLGAYDWPGNIRQLQNAIYRAVVLADDTRLDRHDFPQLIAALAGRDEAVRQAGTLPDPGLPIHIDAPRPDPVHTPVEASTDMDRFLTEEGELKPLDHIERDLIAFAIRHHKGHMSRVARALGIGRSTLYRKLREYGLGEDDNEMAA